MVIRIDFESKNADHQGIKAPQPSKTLRYVRRLHTQRTLFQKKMAAELYPLITWFLDSKPEKYASYFLDCLYVNSVDMFCYFSQKIPDEWIGKVNSFLNSKLDR